MAMENRTLLQPTGQFSNTMSVFLRQCPVAFSIDNVTHNEGNLGTTTPFTFTVTKIGTTTLNASVNFTTQDDTATVADSDYQAYKRHASGSLVWGTAL